jgi:hypothetical protein
MADSALARVRNSLERVFPALRDWQTLRGRLGVLGVGVGLIVTLMLLFRHHPCAPPKWLWPAALAIWSVGVLGDFPRFLAAARLEWLRGGEMPLSFAAARIAVGWAYWSLSPLGLPPAQEYFSWFDPSAYDPVGPFCFLCPAAPSAELFDASRLLLPISSACLIAGFMCRLSLMVSLLSFWVLASGTWNFGFICHGHTPFLLAAIPLLFARCQAFSVDGLWRRLRGQAPLEPRGTRAAVLGAQVMVGLVFLSAASHKIYLGNGEFLRWVFSDSLRNLVINQHFVLHRELSPFLSWVVSDELAWKSLALGAVVCQLLPVSAIFFIRWPWVRLLCGLALMAEVLSLKLVMGLFPQQFMVMVVLFVDWERLTSWLARQPLPALPIAATVRPWALRQVGVFSLIAFQAMIALTCAKSIRPIYPFSAFPMFSCIYAAKPYGEHVPFLARQSVFNLKSEPALTKEQTDALWLMYHATPWLSTDTPEEKTRGIVAMIEGFIAKKEQDGYLQSTPKINIQELDIKAALFALPPYPATEFTLRAEANFGHWKDGKVRAIRWKFRYDKPRVVLDYEPVGFAPEKLRVGLIPATTWKLEPLPGYVSNTGGSLEVGFGKTALVGENSIHLERYAPTGAWLVFISETSDGKEEVWAGPYHGP